MSERNNADLIAATDRLSAEMQVLSSQVMRLTEAVLRLQRELERQKPTSGKVTAMTSPAERNAIIAGISVFVGMSLVCAVVAMLLGLGAV